MLRGAFPDAADLDPDALRRAYLETIGDTIATVGLEAVVAGSPLDRTTVEAVAAGQAETVSLETAGAILAQSADRPDADTITAEARDLLLLGMTEAVLDVERLSSRIDGAIGARAIQAKVEGRQPMTLAEYARLHHAVAAGAE